MQEWQEQAKKNNLALIEKGECQLCGSKTSQGISECVEKSAYVTHRLRHDEGIKHMTVFLSVDAHALQHSEIHGRWSNHFHLTRLYLIFRENIKWNYKYSPILSDVVNLYKNNHLNEVIEAPEAKKEGRW